MVARNGPEAIFLGTRQSYYFEQCRPTDDAALPGRWKVLDTAQLQLERYGVRRRPAADQPGSDLTRLAR
jgi:hypothetical protein